MPTLHVLQGPDKGRTLTTDDELVLIGRASDQIPLTDQTVSRRHAEMRAENGAWVLSDLESANGTYVNGVRVVRPTRLKHGDQIRLGSTLVVYAGHDSHQQLTGGNIPNDMITLDAGSADAAIISSVVSNEDSVIMAAPDTAYAVKSWKVMRELTAAIGTLVSPDQLLPRVMDIVFEEVETDRGVIFIQDEQAQELLPEVVRFRDRKARADVNRAAITASRTILNHVLETREGVLCSNVIGDRRFDSGKSVQNLGMRSLICAPIVAREKILGVIYLDCPVTRHTYNEHELRLITAIGYQTGLAIENARLVQAHLERERLAAAGEAVAYLSHSIKNILQGMRSGADVVERGLTARDFTVADQGWRILDRNMDRCYALMLNMLAFSKQREPQLELASVNKLASDVCELLQKVADDARVMLLTDLDDSVPPVPLDCEGIHQVLLNLVSNAIDAAPRASGVVNVRSGYDSLERRVFVSVSDNGPGVPPDMRQKIFDPFFSTKGHGGTGLGLAVCRKIVHEHLGTIELLDSPGRGSEFVVRLPTADARKVSPGDTQGPSGPRTGL
jgi:two-component system NtrC family sensor kinase